MNFITNILLLWFQTYPFRVYHCMWYLRRVSTLCDRTIVAVLIFKQVIVLHFYKSFSEPDILFPSPLYLVMCYDMVVQGFVIWGWALFYFYFLKFSPRDIWFNFCWLFFYYNWHIVYYILLLLLLKQYWFSLDELVLHKNDHNFLTKTYTLSIDFLGYYIGDPINK